MNTEEMNLALAKKKRRTRDPLERFMEKVNVSGGCWEWTAATTPNGYGQFYFDGRLVLAHRFLISMAIPNVLNNPRLLACHKCDNPLCVRPSHLFLGTQKDNIKDMIRKGRNCDWSKLSNKGCKRPTQQGTKNHQSKLTEAQVVLARACPMSRGAASRMAEQFGVSLSLISGIRRGRRWKYLPTLEEGKDNDPAN